MAKNIIIFVLLAVIVLIPFAFITKSNQKLEHVYTEDISRNSIIRIKNHTNETIIITEVEFYAYDFVDIDFSKPIIVYQDEGHKGLLARNYKTYDLSTKFYGNVGVEIPAGWSGPVSLLVRNDDFPGLMGVGKLYVYYKYKNETFVMVLTNIRSDIRSW